MKFKKSTTRTENQGQSTNITTNDKGHALINNRLQASVDNIYAIGDVNGELQSIKN